MALSLERIEVLERQRAARNEQMRLLSEPVLPQIAPLESIPGVDATAARDMLGEMGTDMRRFGTAARLASWAKVSPGNKVSAGKRRQGRTGKGNRYWRRVLVPWAWAARKTSTFLGHTFRRLAARLGGKRAAVAVGHTMLVIVSHLLWQGTYDEEQRDADQRPKQEARDGKRAITALKRLGYAGTVQRVAESLSVSPKL
jgi:transposase